MILWCIAFTLSLLGMLIGYDAGSNAVILIFFLLFLIISALCIKLEEGEENRTRKNIRK